ncbi:hypothetical protein Daus18300_009834 [Diaporthe australafricana]|uniref:Protein kinase domain-containing protein n=1 Tax=Diaporthe australafricana TaxID=127596 RepID=A0ABR3WCP4_9PEZI
MALRIGQIFNGSKWNYRLVKQLGVEDKTITSKVFKAEVLPGVESVVDPRRRWAVIKTSDSNHWESLKREYNQHSKPYIQSSPYFRQMHDTINPENITTWSPERPFCLVLEWMETTLAQLPAESYYQNPLIVYKIFQALLEGSAQLAKSGQIHSDPELLGVNDIEDPFPPMTWCLAKIMRLFDPDATMAPPPADAPEELHMCFRWARQLVVAPRKENPEELILQTPSYELWSELAVEEGVPKEVLDMIRLLAVPNPEKRPSALQALASREFRALKSAADSWVSDVNAK